MKIELKTMHGVLLAACILSSTLVSAQQASPNDALVSPEVLPDQRVAFRIYAPKATTVALSGDWVTQGLGSAGDMQKNEQGVWSLTVGPLPADFYGYSFSVDGIRTVDPKNAQVKPGIRYAESMFELPGLGSAYAAAANVPHGEVRAVSYYANALKQMRRMQVYTPPGYEQGSARYPVLYLISGGGDDDTAWPTIGRAGFILDNLLAAGKIKPMIVVMPNSNLTLPGVPAVPLGAAARGLDAAGLAARMATISKLHDAFGEELLKDVLPLVEQRYRVLNDAQHRAIAGMAMGGAEALRIAPSHLDMFAYIGVFSEGLKQGPGAAVAPDFEQRNAAFFSNAARTNEQLKVFWISVGKNDEAIQDGAKMLSDVLNKRGIRHEFHETAGGHTWINWRHNLVEFSQLLFR